MPLIFWRSTLGAALWLTLVAAASAQTQKQAPVARSQAARAAPVATSAASPSPDLTAKERLSEKWTDEQRVDNCKVPPDKRGPKPRPDACADVPTN